MGEVYCAEVTTDATLGVTLGTERVLAPGALVAGPEAFGRTWVGAGHGFGSYRELAASWGCPFKCVWPELLPSASSIVQLGAMRLAAGFGLAASAVEPVYLRNNVANQSSPRVPA
jgi:tRNA threonylcarbamoyladenosine biosynthesis protein TsaB